MNKYIVLEIENLQPLKIGSRGVKNQIENSKSYIPGSTIRGAIIYCLINELNLDNNLANIHSGRNYKKELLKDMKCYNAYPFCNKKLFIPSPIHLRADKHDFRKATIDKPSDFKIENLLDHKKTRHGLPIAFISIDYSEKHSKIKHIEIKKELRLHHNKSQDKENLFRYEAIKKGYTFRTIIKTNEDIATVLRQALKNSKLYLGGSKGSGYGLCSVDVIDICDTYKEAKNNMGLKYGLRIGNNLVLTCLSDCIFRDDNGNPSNHINETQLQRILGKKNIKHKRIIVSQGYSEGYNTKWGARYPKESTVKAGSIMVYSCDDKVSNEDLSKLEENLFGMRTTDGYGWIAVNIDYPNEIYLNPEIFSNELKTTNTDIKDERSLDIIIKGLQKAKEKWLRHIFIQEYNKGLIKYNIDNTSNKQNMLSLIQSKKDSIETILNRKYMKDKELFSIGDNSFLDIYNYCYENQEKDSLKQYIENKCNSTKGKLFYRNIDNKEFLKDLVIVSLKVGGKSYGQNN